MVFLPLTPLPQDLNEGLSGARTCLFAAPAAQTRRVLTVCTVEHNHYTPLRAVCQASFEILFAAISA